MNPLNGLTRRGILRILGAAPAMLPAAKSLAPNLLATAEPIAAAAALMQPPGTPAMPAESFLGNALASQVRDLKAQFEAEGWTLQQLREEGIDPDLASLKSTSRAWKIMKMVQRERERFSLMRRLEKTLWP